MKKLISVLALSLTAMLLLGIIPYQVHASPGPTVYMDQSHYYYDTNSGITYFNVTVLVSSTSAFTISMFQIWLQFDASMINVTEFFGDISLAPSYRAWPNDNLGARTFNANYVFYNAAGGLIGNPAYQSPPTPNAPALMWGDMVAADKNVPANTPKILGICEFAITAVPSKYSSLNCSLSINNDDTYLFNSGGAIPDVTKVNSDYGLSWAIPPNPNVAIVRADALPWPLVFNQYGNWTVPPAQFDAKLYIKALNPAWGMTNATITVTWTAANLAAVNTVIGPDWAGPGNTVTPSPGQLVITVFNPAVGGDVLVATITFNVTKQGAYPDPDTITPLTLSNIHLFDHVVEIQYTSITNGQVTVMSEITLPLPEMQVSPVLTELGPAPAVGTEFDVQIEMVHLHFAWHAIAFQFRLHYDQTLLQLVSITEGGLWTDPRWDLYGTYFLWFNDPSPYDISVGDFLLPNGTGDWDQTTFPTTDYGIAPLPDTTMCTIRFRALVQLAHFDLESDLNITGFSDCLLDKDGNWIPMDWETFVNGTYIMHGTPDVGRYIDSYGGALNSGPGAIVFPAPYGGQGPNMPMDLVTPQSQVFLFANVTYNYYPVQHKLVSFEVDFPNGSVYLKRQAFTDENGIATITFRMPWPCVNPEGLFGVWHEIETVEIADITVNDTMAFKYDYAVHIFKVTTNKYFYSHGETINIYIDYGSQMMQTYDAEFTATVEDELMVTIGFASMFKNIGGVTQWCTWQNGTLSLSIWIPKWAYSGYAYVYVNCFDKEPSLGGTAYTPEYAPAPQIYIYPY